MSSHAQFSRSVLLGSGEIQVKYNAEWVNLTNSVRFPGNANNFISVISWRFPGPASVNANNFISVISWRLKLLGGVLTRSSFCTRKYKGFDMSGAVTARLQISKLFQIDKKGHLSR